MSKHVWMLERKVPKFGFVPVNFFYSRRYARDTAKYFNGFAHRTKAARFRVRKYVEAGR
jgi:hypothetical protein